MELSARCQSCGERSLVTDEVSENLICTTCAVVQDYNNFQAHVGGISGPAGTYVRTGTSGSGNNYSYKESKIYKAGVLIDDILFKLNFSVPSIDEVKKMIVTITEGEYGQGDWFSIFVGACAYVVRRKNGNLLPMTDVAAVVCCDTYELGRMVNRVVSFLDLKLPEFDIVYLYETTLRNSPSFSCIEAEKKEVMLKQGVFLVQCLIKWFVTTGRRPVQVVVSVLAFIGQLNQVNVKIEDLASELNVPAVTCRLRYKELLERLVEVARVLPWGKDVNVKNIVKFAPYVIQYMEMKSMGNGLKQIKNSDNVGFDITYFLSDCLQERSDNMIDSYRSCEGDDVFSQNTEQEQSPSLDFANLDKFNISPECLKMIYSKCMEEVSDFRSTSEFGKENRKKRKRHDDYLDCTDWWKGKSELSKKLSLKKILEKDVGMDVMPPAFVNGCLTYQTRRDKIEAAKARIKNIMFPSNAGLRAGNSHCLSTTAKKEKKKKKRHVDVDWEDLIIETLLLHQVYSAAVIA
ncbi:plant-specific TFIIB-related protein PTF2 isoform X2 [Daucus carota subsp. sativus]|uniref:plant-specific TFIIB-related protein PTF2 isoform X2 n=1 Tax=Daucus carota subsp. sativus TaxID=79200 RepID=UPI0030829713